MTLETILTMAITALASSGLVTFFLKQWVEHSFNAKLAKMEAERRVMAYEHQIRFTRFDEKLTVAIEGAYELVCVYSDALKAVVVNANRGTTDAEEMKNLDAIAEQFNRFMQRQSIYLPPELAAKLKETREALRVLVSDELSRVTEREFRLKQTGGVNSPTLSAVYAKASVTKDADDLMQELQALAREHLSRFTQPH